MTGQKTVDEIQKVCSGKYPKAAVVLTLGEEGAYYWEKDKRYYQPAIKASVLDTTAAGDTFTGYFFANLQNGKKPEEALYFAAKAAAIAVSKKGAAGSIPYACEVEK